MGNLLPNSLAVHRSRAFRDLKKEHPDQVDLLVSKHNPGETVIAQKQATGIQNQKNTEQNAHYLLTIQNQAKTMSTRSIQSSTSHASSTTWSPGAVWDRSPGQYHRSHSRPWEV